MWCHLAKMFPLHPQTVANEVVAKWCHITCFVLENITGRERRKEICTAVFDSNSTSPVKSSSSVKQGGSWFHSLKSIMYTDRLEPWSNDLELTLSNRFQNCTKRTIPIIYILKSLGFQIIRYRKLRISGQGEQRLGIYMVYSKKHL